MKTSTITMTFLKRFFQDQKEDYRRAFLVTDLFARRGSESAVEDLAELFCLAEDAGYPSLMRDDLAMLLFEFDSAAVDIDTTPQALDALRAQVNVHLDALFVYLSPEDIEAVMSGRNKKTALKKINRQNARAAYASVGVVSKALH